MTEITAELLRERLAYDADTGVLTWRIDRSKQVRAGQAAGYRRRDGYIVINIGGKCYLAHRLIWLHVTGDWPDDMIDHVNGDRYDNRLSNLRNATRSQNMMNMAVPPASTSGVKGVSYNKRWGKWEAYITVGRKRLRLGAHCTIEAAAAARLNAETELHGEYARQA